MTALLKSLASETFKYIPVQLRVKGGRIHLQAAGSEANRPYGVAANIGAGESLLTWLASQVATLPSMANSDAKYIAAQATESGDNAHIQIAGLSGNRPYGWAFDVEMPTFAMWLEDEISCATPPEEVEAEDKDFAGDVAEDVPVEETDPFSGTAQ